MQFNEGKHRDIKSLAWTSILHPKTTTFRDLVALMWTGTISTTKTIKLELWPGENLSKLLN